MRNFLLYTNQTAVGGNKDLLSEELGDINVFTGNKSQAFLDNIQNQIQQSSWYDNGGSPPRTIGIHNNKKKYDEQEVTTNWHIAEDFDEDFRDLALDLIKDLYPNVRDFFADDCSDRLIAMADGRNVNYKELGGNFVKLIRLITTIFMSDNSFLFIEDMINHFSDQTLDPICLFIAECAKTLKIQVFISTNSQECIDAFKDNPSAFGVETKIFEAKGKENGIIDIKQLACEV